MNATQNIRKTFDLTQEQLAVYLGVTRSCLALAETNRRELPTSALIKLGALERSLHNNAQYQQQHLNMLAEKDSAAMHRHAKECLYKALAKKRKLKALQNKYQCCVQALTAIGHLQNNLPQGKEGTKDQIWLELLQMETTKKLIKCGPAAQMKIKLSVQALEMQAKEAQKYQGKS